MRFISLIATGWMGLMPLGAQADIRFEIRNDSELGAIFIGLLSGEITRQDYYAVSFALEERPASDMKVLVLDSSGGDLFAAMAIGRLVRSNEFTVGVPPSGECLSSCVLVLAAGVERRPQGIVGIHRPYFREAPTDVPAGDLLRESEREVALYLEEMSIPPRLAEDMFSIEPADMKILSPEEMGAYRLNSTDYAHREDRALETMERYGKSRKEYEAFLADLNYTCTIYMGKMVEMKACVDSVADKHGMVREEVDK